LGLSGLAFYGLPHFYMASEQIPENIDLDFKKEKTKEGKINQ
jgi:hypothetical protein